MPKTLKFSDQPVRFTIIVVTWNNESDIEQALRSCIFPGSLHHEVIVVYNKSDDQTFSKVEAITREHNSLFRVIRNDENVGLGEARNQGIRDARGDYIIFLDGDDWFVPEALSVMDSCISANTPDVLYFNFARAYRNGRILPNLKSKLLAEGWRESGTSRASLLRNFGVAWNRAYKTEFLRQHDLSFPRGLYEDVCWNTKVLALAQRLYVIPHILVMYRQRAGSILASHGRQHFDTLDANRRVIAFLRQHPDLLEDFGFAAYRYTQKQLIGTLGVRIPPQDRAEYLVQLKSVITEYESLLDAKKRSVEGEIIDWPVSVHFIVFILSVRRGFRSLIRKLKSNFFRSTPAQTNP
jgi:glycosyltransferase involved in cell wall biosynthesis